MIFWKQSNLHPGQLPVVKTPQPRVWIRSNKPEEQTTRLRSPLKKMVKAWLILLKLDGHECVSEQLAWKHTENNIIYHMGVSKNRGTPKSSILIGFSIINHPFWGIPIFGNTHIPLQYMIIHHEFWRIRIDSLLEGPWYRCAISFVWSMYGYMGDWWVCDSFNHGTPPMPPAPRNKALLRDY